jgi:hypothetical protein
LIDRSNKYTSTSNVACSKHEQQQQQQQQQPNQEDKINQQISKQGTTKACFLIFSLFFTAQNEFSKPEFSRSKKSKKKFSCNSVTAAAAHKNLKNSRGVADHWSHALA